MALIMLHWRWKKVTVCCRHEHNSSTRLAAILCRLGETILDIYSVISQMEIGIASNINALSCFRINVSQNNPLSQNLEMEFLQYSIN